MDGKTSNASDCLSEKSSSELKVDNLLQKSKENKDDAAKIDSEEQRNEEEMEKDRYGNIVCIWYAILMAATGIFLFLFAHFYPKHLEETINANGFDYCNEMKPYGSLFDQLDELSNYLDYLVKQRLFVQVYVDSLSGLVEEFKNIKSMIDDSLKSV